MRLPCRTGYYKLEIYRKACKFTGKKTFIPFLKAAPGKYIYDSIPHTPMREELLHFIWKHNKLSTVLLYTGNQETLVIKATGIQNRQAGPDFFNAKIEIDGQMWVGNIEIHRKSSDWYAHHHQTDENYDNVILHVVWEDDISVFRKDGSQIPTLALKHYLPEDLLACYQNLVANSKSRFINCEENFSRLDPFLVESWLHRLYIERLEQKSNLIFELLKKSDNNWEAVLFALLARSFGSKVNGLFFMKKALQLDFSLIRKTRADIAQLESLLFGHFGLLQDEEGTDVFYKQLQNEYTYLTKKFNLNLTLGKPEFFGLRPAGFPTIRLSQLAQLYGNSQHIFRILMEKKNLEDFYRFFQSTATSSYWETHYTFGKTSKKSRKKLTKSFIDLLILNTLIPLKFCYAKHLGEDWNDELLALPAQIKKEQNAIIKGFETLNSTTHNALESQAKIQLYTQYCTQNKCLQCALGMHLLNQNSSL